LLFKGEVVFYIFISLIIIMVFVPTVYSYLFFKKEKAAY
jgi:hypothetical protein